MLFKYIHFSFHLNWFACNLSIIHTAAGFMAVRVLFCGVWLRSDLLSSSPAAPVCLCLWGTTGAKNLMTQSFRVEEFTSECLTSRKPSSHTNSAHSLQWDLWARVKCGIVLNCSQWISLRLALASSHFMKWIWGKCMLYLLELYKKNTKEMFSLCPSPTLFSVSICSEHCIHCYMLSSGCLSYHVFAVKYAFWNEKPHFSFRQRNEESSQPHNSRSPLKDVYFMFWESFFALEMWSQSSSSLFISLSRLIMLHLSLSFLHLSFCSERLKLLISLVS